MKPPVNTSADFNNSARFYTSNLRSDDLKFASVVQMAQMIREKEVSSVELVNILFDRIAEVNPHINAVVLTCKERALNEAKKRMSYLQRESYWVRCTGCR